MTEAEYIVAKMGHLDDAEDAEGRNVEEEEEEEENMNMNEPHWPPSKTR